MNNSLAEWKAAVDLNDKHGWKPMEEKTPSSQENTLSQIVNYKEMKSSPMQESLIKFLLESSDDRTDLVSQVPTTARQHESQEHQGSDYRAESSQSTSTNYNNYLQSDYLHVPSFYSAKLSKHNNLGEVDDSNIGENEVENDEQLFNSLSISNPRIEVGQQLKVFEDNEANQLSAINTFSFENYIEHTFRNISSVSNRVNKSLNTSFDEMIAFPGRVEPALEMFPFYNSATNITSSFINATDTYNDFMNHSVDSLFEELSPISTRVMFTVCFSIILLVGLAGNLLVIAVVWRERELSRSSTGAFIVNLAIADLLVLSICLPTFIAELHVPPLIWVLPAAMCKVVPFVEFLVKHASVLTILAISLERHHVICQPLSAAHSCTHTRAAVACVAVWVVAVFLASPTLAMTQYYVIDLANDTSGLGPMPAVCITVAEAAWTRVYLMCSDTLLFFLPLLMLLLLFWRIARRLLIEDTRLCRPDNPNPNLQQRRQVVVMLGTVVACFFVCLIPYHVLSLYVLLVKEKIEYDVYLNLLFIFRSLVYVNSTINPLLYNLTSTRFRNSLSKLMGFRRSRQSLSRTSSLHPAELCATAAVTVATNSSSSSSFFRRSWHGRTHKANCTVIYKLDKRFLSSGSRSFDEENEETIGLRKNGCLRPWKYRFNDISNKSHRTKAKNKLHQNNSLSIASTESTATINQHLNSINQLNSDASGPSDYSPTFLMRSKSPHDNSWSSHSSPPLQHSTVTCDTVSMTTISSASSPQLDSLNATCSNGDELFLNNVQPSPRRNRRMKRTNSSSPNIFKRYNSNKKNTSKKFCNRANSLRSKPLPPSNTSSPFLGRSTALTDRPWVYDRSDSANLSPPQYRYSMRTLYSPQSKYSSYKESYV